MKLLTHCHLPEASESWRREAKDYKEEKRFACCCHPGGALLPRCVKRLRKYDWGKRVKILSGKYTNGQVVYYLVEVLSHQVVGRDW